MKQVARREEKEFTPELPETTGVLLEPNQEYMLEYTNAIEHRQSKNDVKSYPPAIPDIPDYAANHFGLWYRPGQVTHSYR